MPPAIRVENLGKSYRVGRTAPRGGYRTLRESLVDTARSTIGRLRRREEASRDEEFWALKDVSFEVQPGEAFGIIGQNGAGKSTLLKILSRITKPTTGRVVLSGRIGSLLEVGTGFHPELSGRENIFLNGSILGMTRREITRRFDEIVAFAEVERFIDTPVKRYSSGMYVRLAFAVAAHMEPEILIVDEVLAVGDLAFQQKCLGKMGEVTSHGRTVLFVSHNMHAMSALTGRCLVLSHGKVAMSSITTEAIKYFMQIMNKKTDKCPIYTTEKLAKNHVLSMNALTSEPSGLHTWGKPLSFELVLHISEPRASMSFSFQIIDDQGRPVCHYWLFESELPFRTAKGEFKFLLEIPKSRLFIGSYSITTWLTDRKSNELIEKISDICEFEITMGSRTRPEYTWKQGDCVYLEDAKWRLIV